jgi:hypothetical protein
MEQEEIEREDPHRDLGYIPRDEIQKSVSEVQKAVNRLTQNRIDHRQKRFELLKQLDPTLIDEGQGTVSLTVFGRQIDFHLLSNTFYLHAKQKFGYGIEDQVKLIKEFLEKHEFSR